MGCAQSVDKRSSPEKVTEQVRQERGEILASSPLAPPPFTETIEETNKNTKNINSVSSENLSSELSVQSTDDTSSSNDLHFKILKKIGSGQYGTVFLALHEPTGTYYAIKQFLSSQHQQHLPDEVRFLQLCIGHPCIVQLHSVILSKRTGLPKQLVMEFIDGTPWGSSEFYLRGGPVPINTESLRFVRGILRDLLLALCYLHDEIGVAHLDIKPENVVAIRKSAHERRDLTPGMYAKLIDFGSAVFCGPGDLSIQTSCTAGTYYYC
eukprot:PhF_6_TR18930/c2_g2_i8/m.27714